MKIEISGQVIGSDTALAQINTAVNLIHTQKIMAQIVLNQIT